MEKGKRPLMMKYCVIGNIVREHQDENGIVRYGTVCYPGRRRIYISRRLWEDSVTVMGLNRFKSRYVTERVPLSLIENIRFSRTFKKNIIENMANTIETIDMWWRYKEEDRIGAMEYAQLLNRIKNGDKEAAERYKREVMEPYYCLRR